MSGLIAIRPNLETASCGTLGNPAAAELRQPRRMAVALWERDRGGDAMLLC